MRTLPPTLRMVSWTTSSPTPRPENSVTTLAVLNPGRNRNSSSSASCILRTTSVRVQAAVDDLPAQLLQIDAAAVVGDGDLQHPGPVAGFQSNRAGGGLARAGANLGRLDPVIDGVADQVRERRFELLQDVAIDLGLLAVDDELRLLSQGPTMSRTSRGRPWTPSPNGRIRLTMTSR